MGTAGPLALANEILNDGTGDPFFVLNRHDLSTAPDAPVSPSVLCLWTVPALQLLARACMHACMQ